MKARIMMAAGLLFLLVSVAGAQMKVTGKMNCPKPDVVGTADAGDRAGHTLTLQKYSCPWTLGMEMEGAKSKDSINTEFVEGGSARVTVNGTHVGTMENGDKYFVAYRSSSAVKNGAPVVPIHGTWSYTGGTGKLKGIAGKGTFTVTPAADGSSVIEVGGDYAIPTGAPKKKAS